jgi:hypothetical protein
MKDIIWTLIVIWLVYKIVDIFRTSSVKRNTNTYSQGNEEPTGTTHKTARADQDLKEAVKKHLNNEGEYVDFEEVK